MRIAIIQGNKTKAMQALNNITALLEEKEYATRFIAHDTGTGWYHCFLRQPEPVADWLKSEFTPYVHANYIDNFGNQIRARYYYLTRNYLPLLTYIEEMKQRESVIFGRVEMLATEACVHYQMKNKAKALDALREAYETALPNKIVTPFIELGKDMRTLATDALREADPGIPRMWLETIKGKSSSYSKYQSIFISEYRKENNRDTGRDLTPREKELLDDLYLGLTRSEIAANRNMAISTVNTTINNLYKKFNARNIADVIRIFSEQKHT
jgi:DNA-binding CsgD family transcriptional regulator